MRDDEKPLVLPCQVQAGIAGLFFCLVLLSRAPSFYRSVLDWDESLYFLMAAQWRAGHLPYTVIWDNKPAGIYAILAVFQAMFGEHIAALRMAPVVFVTICACAVSKITYMIVQPMRQALFCAVTAGLIFILGSLSNDGLASNTELFMASFTALAVWMVLSTRFEERPVLQALLTGLAIGAAFMVKYVAVFEAPVILGLLLTRHHRNDMVRVTAAVVFGAAMPLGFTILLYWQAGDLSLWWDDSIIANLRRLAPTAPAGALRYAIHIVILRWGPLLIAGLAMLLLAVKPVIRLCRSREADRRQIEHLFLTLWLLAGCAGVASAKSFYDHYFLQILPVLCISLGWLLARLAHLPHTWRGILLLAVIMIPGYAAEVAVADALRPVLHWEGFYPKLQPDTPAQIAMDIDSAAQTGAIKPLVYVFDYQPIIYALVDQAPPTRYVLPTVLTGKFLSGVAGVSGVAEIARILAENPGFIVCARRPNNRANLNPAVYDEINQTLNAKYEIWRNYKDAILYRLKPQN